MPRPIFFVRVKTQFENLGDALINRELIRLLSGHGDLVLILSGVPDRFARWIDNAIPSDAIRTGWLGYWRRLGWALLCGRRCWVVLNPGGYVGEVGPFSMIGKLAGAARLRGLRILGCKTMLVGVSYERLGQRLMTSLRAQARALDFHAPRDCLTAQYCSANGITYDKIMPDLAFALEPLPNGKERAAKALASFRQQPGQDPISSLCELLPANFQLDFTWQVDTDAAYQQHLHNRWTDLGNLSISLPLTEGIEAARKVYQTYRIVYSNRLHVLLLAMSAGAYAVPVLKPGHGQKIRGIYEDLGLQSRIVEIGGPTQKTDPNRDRNDEITAYKSAKDKLIRDISDVLRAS